MKSSALTRIRREQENKHNVHKWRSPEFISYGVALYSCAIEGCEARQYRATNMLEEYRIKVAALNRQNGYPLEDEWATLNSELIDEEISKEENMNWKKLFGGKAEGESETAETVTSGEVTRKEQVGGVVPEADIGIDIEIQATFQEEVKGWSQEQWHEFIGEMVQKFKPGETGFIKRAAKFYGIPVDNLKGRYLGYLLQQKKARGEVIKHGGGWPKNKKRTVTGEIAGLPPVPPKPSKIGIVQKDRIIMSQYHKENKAQILDELEKYGRQFVMQRWDICGSTMTTLTRRWKGKASPVTVPSTERLLTRRSGGEPGGKPRFPDFNNGWDPAVQVKWLEMYPQVVE